METNHNIAVVLGETVTNSKIETDILYYKNLKEQLQNQSSKATFIEKEDVLYADKNEEQVHAYCLLYKSNRK